MFIIIIIMNVNHFFYYNKVSEDKTDEHAFSLYIKRLTQLDQRKVITLKVRFVIIIANYEVEINNICSTHILSMCLVL